MENTGLTLRAPVDKLGPGIVVRGAPLLESASLPEVHRRTSHVENHFILIVSAQLSSTALASGMFSTKSNSRSRRDSDLSTGRTLQTLALGLGKLENRSHSRFPGVFGGLNARLRVSFPQLLKGLWITQERAGQSLSFHNTADGNRLWIRPHTVVSESQVLKSLLRGMWTPALSWKDRGD